MKSEFRICIELAMRIKPEIKYSKCASFFMWKFIF
ncbi:hypothetical protein HCH_06543 [Hahella chejuensis KCTC 2396]|uniref:Uncharacterized protein n=1 Tax=Hahella chejuensis (strain KCTC 2396) TaxID=349521 RepID=Q2S842_HAHCH|nr:hypothetical protein HCH_06543 [Hahella chejuensis KCTC 2396]